MSEDGDSVRMRYKVHIGNGRTGHKEVREGARPGAAGEDEPARIPRVARLLALAHHFDDLLREGAVRDQAELARLCRVTRARITQIMNLLYLAPDIQEAVLFLTATKEAPTLTVRRLHPFAGEVGECCRTQSLGLHAVSTP